MRKLEIISMMLMAARANAGTECAFVTSTDFTTCSSSAV